MSREHCGTLPSTFPYESAFQPSIQTHPNNNMPKTDARCINIKKLGKHYHIVIETLGLPVRSDVIHWRVPFPRFFICQIFVQWFLDYCYKECGPFGLQYRYSDLGHFNGASQSQTVAPGIICLQKAAVFGKQSKEQSFPIVFALHKRSICITLTSICMN